MTDNPAAASPPVVVTGLVAGQNLVGIDYRPADGQLYTLGVSAAGTAQLYTINPTTGAATAVGTTGSFVAANGTTVVPIAGTGFGFDFNPVVDRIRVTTSTGQNFRINPITGAFVDGNFGGAAASVPGLYRKRLQSAPGKSWLCPHQEHRSAHPSRHPA